MMHQHALLADLKNMLAVGFDIVDRLGDKTRLEARGGSTGNSRFGSCGEGKDLDIYPHTQSGF